MSADERDPIEVGESVEVTPVLAEDGSVVGAVVDDLLVITGEAGSITDETIDVVDGAGRVIAEDEVTKVYDADGNLIATEERLVIEE